MTHMPSVLDNLDRDAAMMLYVAGELDADERAAFERRVASEPQLAAEVEQLRAAQSSVAAELERADGYTRLPASEGVVVRRISRAMNQWLANRDATPAVPQRRAVTFPWWSYPSAAAAILIVGFLVWSSRQEVGPLDASPEAKREISNMEVEQQELADWMSNSLDANAYASADVEVDRLLSAAGRNDGPGEGRPAMTEEVSQ
jgi:anti-sigma factor RsiW